MKIMDPKMDSGFLEQGEALDDDYDVLRELLPEEVVGIMDQLLCFEVRYMLDTELEKIPASDTDLRDRRWHGIWGFHFRSAFSPPSTLID